MDRRQAGKENPQKSSWLMWESEGQTWKEQSQGWSCLAGVLGMLWGMRAQPELWGRKGVRSSSRKSIQLGNPTRLQPTFPAGFARGRNQGPRPLKRDQVPEHPLGAAQGRLTDTRGLCHPLHHPDIACAHSESPRGSAASTAKATSRRCLWSEEVPPPPLTQPARSKGHRPCCRAAACPHPS